MAVKKPVHKKKPRSANKIGRNQKKCEKYRRENRREVNKARRAARIRRGLHG